MGYLRPCYFLSRVLSWTVSCPKVRHDEWEQRVDRYDEMVKGCLGLCYDFSRAMSWATSCTP